jgi:hypothetical protein
MKIPDNISKRVILVSKNGYDKSHDEILFRLIEQRVLLFCAIGVECELWHDIMDELIVGDGDIERDFEMITTWHTDEDLDDVITFAEIFDLGNNVSSAITFVEV